MIFKENDFLKLFLATVVVQRRNSIIYVDMLQKKLYDFYEKNLYDKLIGKIMVDEEKKILNLENIIQEAYINNMLYIIRDKNQIGFLIKISYQQALDYISDYQEYSDLMADLCNNVFDDGNKVLRLKKKRKEKN